MPATVPDRLRGIRRQRGVARPLAGCSGKLSRVIALASPAFTFTFGLLVTFLGIGVIANVLIAYAVVQVLGERQQNEEHRSQLDG
jgi:Flp pilus assembly protein TadB